MYGSKHCTRSFIKIVGYTCTRVVRSLMLRNTTWRNRVYPQTNQAITVLVLLAYRSECDTYNQSNVSSKVGNLVDSGIKLHKGGISQMSADSRIALPHFRVARALDGSRTTRHLFEDVLRRATKLIQHERQGILRYTGSTENTRLDNSWSSLPSMIDLPCYHCTSDAVSHTCHQMFC